MRGSFRLLLFLCAVVVVPAYGQNFDLQRDRMPLAELKGQFRFHTGDDARWADPGFDDSNWSLLRSDQSWYAQGYNNYSGFGWYRFRVNVPAGEKNLALFIPALRDSYAVYANGRVIGQIGEFPPHGRVVLAPNQVFDLPASSAGADRTIVIAVRVWQWPLLAGTPVAGFDAPPVVGDAAEVARWADLQIHDRLWSLAGDVFVLLVDILGAVLGLALFLLRRGEREYLWFGVSQTLFTIYELSVLATFFLNTPFVLDIWITDACGVIGLFLNLVFFHVLLHQRRRLLLWVGGAPVLVPLAFLCAMSLGLTGFQTIGAVMGVCIAPYTIAVVLVILNAARRGNSEAWLLLGPFGANTLSTAFFCATTGSTLAHIPGWPRSSTSLRMGLPGPFP